MRQYFMKALLVAFASISGYVIIWQIAGNPRVAIGGFISGILIAVIAFKFEERVNRTPFRIVIGGAIGLIIGLLLANIITYPLVSNYFNTNAYLELSIYIFANCILGYLGLSIGMKKGNEFNFGWFGKIAFPEKEKYLPVMVVDTNVIIDGRLADICETGFIEARLMIPRFVLEELQYIADSQDQVKKSRGTRGLDILEKLQKDKFMEVVISDEEFPQIKQVDMKLVQFAKKYSAKILTNDINLNKVAKLNGVSVLNINMLANALKPIIPPGETMKIAVLKEGKEGGQGVGYLDDGTMVVIDNGSSFIGRTVDVTITSILQTPTGRMIFSRAGDGKKTVPSVRAVL